jgi:hypothetical protein
VFHPPFIQRILYSRKDFMKETWHPKEIGVKEMAQALAASIPPHLGQPTTPPLAWHQTGEIVVVILADGRKVSATVLAINALMFPPAVGAGVSPARSSSRVDLDKVEVDIKTKPAARRGGKGKS